MLHNTEANLFFNNERDPTQLFQFDLESGKIVQQVQTGKEFIDFKQITNETKNGQRNPGGTLLGLEK
jgi:hypothetical protein